MIRKLSGLVLLALVAFACNTQQKDENTVFTVNSLLAEADAHIDSVIFIEGLVSHVCKHGGEKLHLMDVDSTNIRVDAGDKIVKFDETLEGSTVIVEGYLRELRIDEEYLQEWEAELAELPIDTGVVAEVETEEPAEGTEVAEGTAHPEPAEGEVRSDAKHERDVAGEMANIKQYREEIAASAKGYLSRYFIEAISFKEKVAE